MSNTSVQNFKILLEEDGKSVKTVESYFGDTTAFVTFLEGKGVDFNGEMKRFYITSYIQGIQGTYTKRLNTWR